jgi:hypothetical protein
MKRDTYGFSVPVMHSKGLAGSFKIGRRLQDIQEREIPGLVKLAIDTAHRIGLSLRHVEASSDS